MNAASMEASLDAKTLEAEATRLHEEILKHFINLDNVWRTAWILDTLLDSYRILGRKAAPGDSQKALDALNPMERGNWWDDFGWIGIAALRAAEQNTFPGDSDKFLQIAINAWAYMYGPGWSTTGNEALYPFIDGLPGWKDFQGEDGKHDNIGTLNAWDALRKANISNPDDWIEQQKPRFTPGGAWNSPISLEPDPNDDKRHPILRESYVGNITYLNPAQNTVTNSLFSLLSLRILRASSTTAFKAVFDASGLNLSACRDAWNNQAAWLDTWCGKFKDQRESLAINLSSSFSAILIRERVSTFATYKPKSTMYWDESYNSDLAWTGDQGLMLGVLREGAAAGITKPLFKQADLIVSGVFQAGFVDYHYAPSTARVRLLQPWIRLDYKGDHRFDAPAPNADTDDYLTGIAVFMRYMLQAYEATPSMLPLPYAQTILRAAAAICTPGFASRPLQSPGICDGYYDTTVRNVEGLAPLVNRLSTLLLAIAILRKQAHPGESAH